jgi:hypothetical protein
MMRLIVLAIVFGLAGPGAAFAQSADKPPARISPRSGPASQGWPHDPVPRFTIPPRGTVALPQIGLPLPPHGLQAPSHRSRPPVDRHSRDHRRRGRIAFPSFLYIAPPYLMPPYVEPVFPEPAPIEMQPQQEQPVATGRLVLDGLPADAQVFVDGYYAGVPEDFSRANGGGVIEAGPHRIDVSAPGFEPIVLSVNIAANQLVTYRAPLQRLAKVPEGPKAPTTFYLIPGCYMGNVPPREANLPATCDLKRAVEFKY